MPIFEALKRLLDVLQQAIEPNQFQDLLDVMQEDRELGASIASALQENVAHRKRLHRLLKECRIREGGLTLLWEALRVSVDPKLIIWSSLEQAFQTYQKEVNQASQPHLLDLTTCAHQATKQWPALRAKLQELASEYGQLDAERLQAAIARVMDQEFGGRLADTVFPSFFEQGPIRDWADLLRRSSRDPLELDQKFMNAFEMSLARAEAELDSPALASLLVMVLRPPNLPETEACTAYDFRAYFCPDENASPDRWLRVRVKDQPIQADTWLEDLQSLLREAIRSSRSSLVPSRSTLLLEVFLPSRWLNEDIGERIKLQTRPGESEPLNSYYRIVVRSAERFQYFQEGQAEEVPNPLPDKWRHARRSLPASEPPCHWWHDPTPASRSHSPKAETVIKAQFNALRAKPGFFALKRSAPLPHCPRLRHMWVDQMIWACPAVALWWRPRAKTREDQRHDVVRAFCGAHRNGAAAPQHSDPSPDQNAPFTHPDTANPLRLFHAFASMVFEGRLSTDIDTARAFRELVVLMDSEERWPPPLVCPPSPERASPPGGPISAPRDEICFSG
ncbi:MAG: vWA-MoxR associated protein C-terminal domain [Cyanobacteriota bacterium]